MINGKYVLDKFVIINDLYSLSLMFTRYNIYY